MWILKKIIQYNYEKKIAVEIIYDDEKIVGYKEIDPDSIVLGYDVDGTEVWIQYPNDKSKKRVLYKTQILTNFYSKDDLESEYEELDLMKKLEFKIDEKTDESRKELIDFLSKNTNKIVCNAQIGIFLAESESFVPYKSIVNKYDVNSFSYWLGSIHKMDLFINPQQYVDDMTITLDDNKKLELNLPEGVELW